VTPRPSAKQIRDSFEQPTMWQAVAEGSPGAAVESCGSASVVGSAPGLCRPGGTIDPSATAFLLALQPERKAA
jgi:hypothetical protein